MIYADSGGWFALFVPDDKNHDAAVQWHTQNTRPLLTTDYIVDETLTLMKARGEYRRALTLGRQFFSNELAVIHYLTQDDINEAWRTFAQFSDKEWSFTDCTSRVVMARLGITEAFAFDLHFSQFGTVQTVPQQALSA